MFDGSLSWLGRGAAKYLWRRRRAAAGPQRGPAAGSFVTAPTPVPTGVVTLGAGAQVLAGLVSRSGTRGPDRAPVRAPWSTSTRRPTSASSPSARASSGTSSPRSTTAASSRYSTRRGARLGARPRARWWCRSTSPERTACACSAFRSLSRTPGAPAGLGLPWASTRGRCSPFWVCPATRSTSWSERARWREPERLLKMKELAEASGVSAGTIKHYLREGLGSGADVVKTSRNMAYYLLDYVERIKLIRNSPGGALHAPQGDQVDARRRSRAGPRAGGARGPHPRPGAGGRPGARHRGRAAPSLRHPWRRCSNGSPSSRWSRPTPVGGGPRDVEIVEAISRFRAGATTSGSASPSTTRSATSARSRSSKEEVQVLLDRLAGELSPTGRPTSWQRPRAAQRPHRGPAPEGAGGGTAPPRQPAQQVMTVRMPSWRPTRSRRPPKVQLDEADSPHAAPLAPPVTSPFSRPRPVASRPRNRWPRTCSPRRSRRSTRPGGEQRAGGAGLDSAM